MGERGWWCMACKIQPVVLGLSYMPMPPGRGKPLAVREIVTATGRAL